MRHTRKFQIKKSIKSHQDQIETIQYIHPRTRKCRFLSVLNGIQNA